MTHIVVEGQNDAMLLQALLGDLKTKFDIVVANGRDAARPIARKILTKLQEPTALVFDADTTEQYYVEEELLSLKDYFSWRAFEIGFILVPLIPTIEVIFFDRPKTLHNRLQRPLEFEVGVAAKIAPKQILDRLIKELGYSDLFSFIKSIDKSEARDLAKQKEIASLRRFIKDRYEEGRK
jgi:hypothetical protein